MEESRVTHMERALDLALESVTRNTGPFGCVIVKDNEVIAEGWNQVTELNDPTAHAEMQAIRKACAVLKSFQLTDCDVYTSCYPGPMCLGALYWARPRAVYYANTPEEAADIGFDDRYIYEQFSKPDEKRDLSFTQVRPDDPLRAFSAWRDNADKIAY